MIKNVLKVQLKMDGLMYTYAIGFGTIADSL